MPPQNNLRSEAPPDLPSSESLRFERLVHAIELIVAKMGGRLDSLERDSGRYGEILDGKDGLPVMVAELEKDVQQLRELVQDKREREAAAKDADITGRWDMRKTLITSGGLVLIALLGFLQWYFG